MVSRSHIFLTAHDERNTLLVLAFDRANGRELWRRELPRARKDRLDGQRPGLALPVTDGKRVFAFFQDFGLIALTVDGKRALAAAARSIQHGLRLRGIADCRGRCGAARGGPGHGPYLLAVHAGNGRINGKVDRPGVISGYSTPTVYQPKDGGTQIIVPESFQLSAYPSRMAAASGGCAASRAK